MKTIVGLFDARSDANAVVQDLVNLGIDRDDIGMVANDPTASTPNDWKMTGVADIEFDRTGTTDTSNAAADGAITGATIGGVGGILLSLSALAIPGVGPVIAAGPLLAGLIGAGIGAAVGGLVGALTEVGVPEEQAGYFNEGVRRGGTLVSVRADEEDVDDIIDIMNRYHPVNVDERVSSWRAEGWTGTSGRESTINDSLVTDNSRFNTSTTNGKTVRPSYESASNSPLGSTQPVLAEYDEHYASQRPTPTDWQDTQNQFDDSEFRSHYQSTYANTGRAYDDYAPAYRYGYGLRNHANYRERSWSEIENEIHRDWSISNTGRNWEDFKDAVRRGWERTKEAVRL